jgi:hypothetical protein
MVDDNCFFCSAWWDDGVTADPHEANTHDTDCIWRRAIELCEVL